MKQAIKVSENWGVLISQTGSEVVSLSRELGILPSLIVTNDITKILQKNLDLFGKCGVTVKTIPKRPTVGHYLKSGLLEKPLVTLHGYLRILPAEVIEAYKPHVMYNGHPGLITEFPELKGKDPQIRAWEGCYQELGSVIHEVVEGVDEGDIVEWYSVSNEGIDSLDDTYTTLAKTSLETWKLFFKKRGLVD